MLELLAGAPGGPVDLVVLARYMRILARLRQALSPAHHQHPPLLSARLRRGGPVPPRQRTRGQAHRGHRALRHRAAGQRPHLEQDVIRVSHRHRLDELKILGRDIEQQVLRAVRWHLEDRVLVDGNKTIVFA